VSTHTTTAIAVPATGSGDERALPALVLVLGLFLLLLL